MYPSQIVIRIAANPINYRDQADRGRLVEAPAAPSPSASVALARAQRAWTDADGDGAVGAPPTALELEEEGAFDVMPLFDVTSGGPSELRVPEQLNKNLRRQLC